MKNQDLWKSTLPMRAAKIGCVLLSASLCLLGLGMVLLPDFPPRLAGILGGALFLALGCARLAGYFSRDLFRLAFQYDLEFGILTMVLGVLMMVYSAERTGFRSAALGVLVLADALFRLRIIRDAKRFGISAWWLILILALAAAAAAVILTFRPGTVHRVFLGLNLLAEGLLSLGTVLTMVKIIRNQIKD